MRTSRSTTPQSRSLGAARSFALLALLISSLLASWGGCAAGGSNSTTSGGGNPTQSGPTTTSSTGNGGNGGGGGDGGVQCGAGEKLCSVGCVKVDDPAFGCGVASCDPCPTLNNATSVCTGGVCSLGGCNSGFENCDGTEANGCEVSTASDPQQCGACGSPCVIPHATAGCNMGMCQVDVCDNGFTDCNMDPTDGCEAKLDVDPKHCGTCTKACVGEETCQNGMCGLFCPKGKADCNNDVNDGCETPLYTSTNCAFCGDVCDLANSTSSCDMMGVCNLNACNTGWANCDMIAPNGCETNTQTDAGNCGSCGNICPSGPHSTAVCVNGGCKLNCDPGYDDCDNNPTTGCEIHTDVDPLHCGACTTTCNLPNATPACAGGKCEIMMCNAGYSNCDMQTPDGCEINTKTDPNNCGGCGIKCSIANGSAACVNGMCAVGTCNPGYQDCDGNVANGCETNTGADINNCGMCGKVCGLANANQACTGGICTIGSCKTGYADCNNTASDGCEINTTNDTTHCGSCTTQCFVANGTAGCANSACIVSACNTGWGNCNGFAQDGCETDLTSNTANCGTCGTVCSTACTGNVAATTCSNSACQITVCNAGAYNIDGTCSNGCECVSKGTSSACASPTALPAIGLGSSTSYTGNLVPAGQEAYLQVTFSGNTSTSYHPRITMTAGTAEFAFDVLSNCQGTAMTCAVEGGSSTGRTDWETSYAGPNPAADPNSKTAGGVSNFNPIPPVGTNGTVLIRVFRRAGKPVSCNNYTLSITN